MNRDTKGVNWNTSVTPCSPFPAYTWIDILQDNVATCRERLFGIFDQVYTRIFQVAAKNECQNSVQYILEQNITQGDALTLKTVGDNPRPIVFAEWSPVNGSMLKRRYFAFCSLLEHESMRELPLFSDLGEDQPFWAFTLGSTVVAL